MSNINQLDLLKEMLEDADLFGFIRASSFVDCYDYIAEDIFPRLSKDLSISQLQNIIWDAFYRDLCVCEIGISKEPWILDRDQAVVILGPPDRFKGVALNIRHQFLS